MENEESHVFLLPLHLHVLPCTFIQGCLLLSLILFLTVFIEETNKAISSLQSVAMLENSFSEMQSVSLRRFSQFTVSLASFSAM